MGAQFTSNIDWVTFLNISNITTIVFGTITLVFSIKIYEMTKATAVLWLVATAGYILFARTLISISQARLFNGELEWIASHSSYFILPYWPLKAFAIVALFLALKSILPSSNYSGIERRKNG